MKRTNAAFAARIPDYVAEFTKGAIAALIVIAIWFVATGDTPSLLTVLLISETTLLAWAAVQAVRFRRKWAALVDAYHQPDHDKNDPTGA